MSPVDQNLGNFATGSGQGIPFSSLQFMQLSSIPPGMLWWVFAVFALATGIMTLVLFYHWIKYGAGIARVGIMGTLYLAGAGLFLAAMFFAISAFQYSHLP